jgi:hypothetical protein
MQEWLVENSLVLKFGPKTNKKLAYININLYRQSKMKISHRCKGLRKFKWKLKAKTADHLGSKMNSKML